MLAPGDIVELDLGVPAGSEAGLRRPAIVVTAGRILTGEPNVIQVVPLTRTIRHSTVEVLVEPDAGNGLAEPSSAPVSACAAGRDDSDPATTGKRWISHLCSA